MRSAPIAAAALASGLVILAATGCGGSDGEPERPPPPPRLSAAELRLVKTYEGRIQTHCVRVARSLVNPRAAPSPSEERRAFEAADALAALAARKPTAPVDVGQDLRLYLSDVVENLQGSNCDPRMLARLERALAAIPVE